MAGNHYLETLKTSWQIEKAEHTNLLQLLADWLAEQSTN